jgi:hypothetical protein
LKGRRQHAKTDRLDARHLRELLEDGKLPECWIPPRQVLEMREALDGPAGGVLDPSGHG